MKRIFKAISAVSLAAVMMLTGCDNKNNSGSGNNTSADTAAQTSRPAKVEKFTCISSTGAGNSGDVTLRKGDTYAVISVRDFGDIKIKLFPEEAPYAVYNFTEIAKKGDYNGRKFHRLVENFMIQGGSPNGDGAAGNCIDGGNFKNEVNTSLRHYYGALCYAQSNAGDIGDGFYIVNNKESVGPSAYYERSESSYSQTAEVVEYCIQALDKNDSDYDRKKSIYDRLYEYNTGAASAIKAMKETITDEVLETYKKKGGVPYLDGAYTVFGQTVEGFEVIDRITSVEKVDDGTGNISKPASEIIIDKIEIFTME